MFKTILLGLAAAGFTFASITVSATSDDQYPASNFQPKVVYIDNDLAEQLSDKSVDQPMKKISDADSASNAQFDPKYPAAYFQPKVIYP